MFEEQYEDEYEEYIEDQPEEQRSPPSCRQRLRYIFVYFLPSLVILCTVVTVIMPRLWATLNPQISQGENDERRVATQLAPFFTPQVTYWNANILQWAEAYQIDPNLVATIMQIESCGDPEAVSSAGAQGLMQVMPQHFAAGQNMRDPDTNARRGLDILTECLYSPYNTEQDVGMAFACYNGGPSIFVNTWEYWPQQSRDYYIWGTNIYQDARANAATSDTLNEWLLAGGQTLCINAQNNLFPADE